MEDYDCAATSEATSVYDLVSHTKSPILTAHDLSTNSHHHATQSAGNPTRCVNFKKDSEEDPVPEKQRLSFNGFIGDFKQFRDWKGSEEDTESDDDVISIEETYREVGQYKSQQSPSQTQL